MAESARLGSAPPPEPAIDLRVALLREKGAERFDPVRFRFIEALARRARTQRDEVRGLVEARLSDALAAYTEGFERHKASARKTVARITQNLPEQADDLQRLLLAGDLRAIARLASRPKDRQSPLAELNVYLAQHSPESAAGRLSETLSEASGSRGELKAIRYFRNTWSSLSVDKQVAQAMAQGPENAGPLNSHRLVLNSLALMRDISPDYLKRFMSYVDTLLVLDQTDVKDKPAIKKPLLARKK